MKTILWEDFKDLPHGTKGRFIIDGSDECEGAISISKDRVYYICTDRISGNNAPDKLGYKLSWQVTQSNCRLVKTNLGGDLYPIF